MFLRTTISTYLTNKLIFFILYNPISAWKHIHMHTHMHTHKAK